MKNVDMQVESMDKSYAYFLVLIGESIINLLPSGCSFPSALKKCPR
jgi:hypothetical protein